MNEIQCPNCHTGESLKEIRYGMPSDEFDESKFHIGGCMPGNATMHCTKCDWENGEGFIDFPAIF